MKLPPFPPGTKFKVGSKTETVDAPVGTFTNCYRLDVVYPTNALVGSGYKSFTFAQGVGLVAFVRFNSQGLWEYRLRSAKVKGPDGQVYTVAE